MRMEKTSIERQVHDWFQNRKLGKADIERERINKNIQSEKHRMVENRYMPFFGNPRAKLVYCNLNPGNANFSDGNEDSKLKQFILQYEKCLSSDSADELLYFLCNFGDFASRQFNMKFDRKQLVFLYGFNEIANENGVDIGIEFQGEPNLDETGLRAVVHNESNQRNLFNNRLQLELIPYASNKFETKKIDSSILSEYFQKLLDEVFSAPRSFVLLQGGAYFELLKTVEGVETISEQKMDSTNAQVFLYRITRNRQSLIFIVAPTFQGRSVQSYMGGYSYGKFCASAIFQSQEQGYI